LPFEPIKTNRLYIKVAEQILLSVRSGEYPPGSRLPQERQLTEMLGVSRPTMREALAALEVLGFVETVAGQGTFVRESSAAMEQSLPLAGPAIDEVVQARRVCEIGVGLELARTQADLSLAQTVIETMRQCDAQGDADRFVDAGLAFHNALAACLNSGVLTEMLKQLTSRYDQPLFRLLNVQSMASHVARQSQIEEHQAIVEAIGRGQPDTIIVVISNHLDRLQTRMTAE